MKEQLVGGRSIQSVREKTDGDKTRDIGSFTQSRYVKDVRFTQNYIQNVRAKAEPAGRPTTLKKIVSGKRNADLQNSKPCLAGPTRRKLQRFIRERES